MTLRANYFALADKGMEILMNQESYLRGQFSISETLTISVWELVKLRISQINELLGLMNYLDNELLGQSWLERKPDFFAFKIAD